MWEVTCETMLYFALWKRWPTTPFILLFSHTPHNEVHTIFLPFPQGRMCILFSISKFETPRRRYQRPYTYLGHIHFWWFYVVLVICVDCYGDISPTICQNSVKYGNGISKSEPIIDPMLNVINLQNFIMIRI